MRLFGKIARVEIGSRRFRAGDGDGFDLAFVVEKKASGAHNTLELKLYNLGPTVRSEVEGASRETVVSLAAGYRGDGGANANPPELFLGTFHHASTERQGPDTITTIEARDGGRQIRRARINESFGPGTSAETVIKACARALGVGTGNLNDLATGAALEATGSRTFSEGFVLSGWAWEELQQLARALGLQVSVQSGELQLRRRGRALQGTAVLLRKGTGLLDAKPAGRSRRGAVMVTMQLIPGVWPGRRVRIEHEEVEGTFRVTKARYEGYTRDDTWRITAECRPLEQRGGEA